jgi:hypothetical protein
MDKDFPSSEILKKTTTQHTLIENFKHANIKFDLHRGLLANSSTPEF